MGQSKKTDAGSGPPPTSDTITGGGEVVGRLRQLLRRFDSQVELYGTHRHHELHESRGILARLRRAVACESPNLQEIHTCLKDLGEYLRKGKGVDIRVIQRKRWAGQRLSRGIANDTKRGLLECRRDVARLVGPVGGDAAKAEKLQPEKGLKGKQANKAVIKFSTSPRENLAIFYERGDFRVLPSSNFVEREDAALLQEVNAWLENIRNIDGEEFYAIVQRFVEALQHNVLRLQYGPELKRNRRNQLLLTAMLYEGQLLAEARRSAMKARGNG